MVDLSACMNNNYEYTQLLTCGQDSTYLHECMLDKRIKLLKMMKRGKKKGSALQRMTKIKESIEEDLVSDTDPVEVQSQAAGDETTPVAVPNSQSDAESISSITDIDVRLTIIISSLIPKTILMICIKL